MTARRVRRSGSLLDGCETCRLSTWASRHDADCRRRNGSGFSSGIRRTRYRDQMADDDTPLQPMPLRESGFPSTVNNRFPCSLRIDPVAGKKSRTPSGQARAVAGGAGCRISNGSSLPTSWAPQDSALVGRSPCLSVCYRSRGQKQTRSGWGGPVSRDLVRSASLFRGISRHPRCTCV